MNKSNENITLPATKRTVKTVTIDPLVEAVRAAYSQSDFDKNVEAWGRAISEGKTTPDILIQKITQAYTLTDGQIEKIRGLS